MSTSSSSRRFEVIGVRLPIIETGADVGRLIVESVKALGIEIEEGDVVVVTEKILSKAYGRVVDISSIKPSDKALKLAKRSGLDPRFVELVLRECDEVLAAIL